VRTILLVRLTLYIIDLAEHMVSTMNTFSELSFVLHAPLYTKFTFLFFFCLHSRRSLSFVHRTCIHILLTGVVQSHFHYIGICRSNAALSGQQEKKVRCSTCSYISRYEACITYYPEPKYTFSRELQRRTTGITSFVSIGLIDSTCSRSCMTMSVCRDVWLFTQKITGNILTSWRDIPFHPVPPPKKKDIF